ncbi:MAG: histidine kinase dimerization/phospho-acceptor domain-containing protein, partial [Bacteroidota bacterium]
MSTPSTDALIRALPYPAVFEGEERLVVAVSTPFRQQFLLDELGDLTVPATMEALIEAVAPLFSEPDATIGVFEGARKAGSQGDEHAPAHGAAPSASRLDCADGRTFELRFTPIEEETFALGGVWHFWDVTEAARAAEATQQAEALAEHAVEVRHSFVSAMSHEIKTPMNAVVGMAHLLAETELDDAQEELVHALQRSVDHLLGLLTDVLDFSRLETGGTTFAADPFDLRALVESLRARYASEAAARDLAFHVELDDVPAPLLGDAVRLEQVLANLLDNALTFTHEGTVHLRVRLERVQGGRA